MSKPAPAAAPEVLPPELGFKTPLGDILLMTMGVAFVACLVAHHIFGVGKTPAKQVPNEKS